MIQWTGAPIVAMLCSKGAEHPIDHPHMTEQHVQVVMITA
jgi:hypothetical protein